MSYNRFEGIETATAKQVVCSTKPKVYRNGKYSRTMDQEDDCAFWKIARA